MRYSLVVLSILLLSGCSFFGIYNRANDYQQAEELPPTLLPDGSELVGIDKYSIPLLETLPARPENNAVPAPFPLVIEEVNESTSLSDYRSVEINPRIDRDGSGALIMHLEGNFTALWAAVTDAIAQSSLKLTDLNRSTGTWYLEITETDANKKPSWWARWRGKTQAVTQIYQLKLSRTRSGGHLSVLEDADTLAAEELSQTVLAELQQKLQK